MPGWLADVKVHLPFRLYLPFLYKITTLAVTFVFLCITTVVWINLLVITIFIK